MDPKRPGYGTQLAGITTPRAAHMIALLGGGARSKGVLLTKTELEHVKRLYGFKNEDLSTNEGKLMHAGMTRNAFRHLEGDGARMLAWFARYVPAGADPLKHLVQIVSEAGLDVEGEDVEWAYAEKEPETVDS